MPIEEPGQPPNSPNFQVVGDDGSVDPILVRNVLPNPPVSDKHVVPSGWLLCAEKHDGTSIYKVVELKDGTPKHIPVSSRPVVVTRWIDNLTTRLKMLEIAWCARGKWRKAIVPREVARDATKMLRELVPRGFPAHTENARMLSSYLAAYEDRNIWGIEGCEVSHQMGWVNGGFLCGRKAIGSSVEFLGVDVGDEQAADAVCRSGTWGGWCDAVSVVQDYPLVEVSLYASLAAPVLEVLKAPNFCVEWAGSTSVGKTTAARVAASVWGNPDERCPDSFVTTWDNTAVGLETLAHTRSHLPLIVDDTKRAKKVRGQSQVPSVIYQVAQGRGRGRANKTGGTRQTLTWRTVMISTGETRISDESKDGGAAARTISIWGKPFGGDGDHERKVVDELNQGLRDHHGHAGPAFVKWLLANQGQWPVWRERYSAACRVFAGKLPPDGPNARIADYLAVLDVVTHLAHSALKLPWEYRPVVRDMVSELAGSASDSDRALQALEHIYSWCVGLKSNFWGQGDHQPSAGWLGRWDEDATTRPWPWIGVRPGPLKDELARAGYDAAAVIRIWSDRGWLKTSGRNRTAPTRIEGHPVWCVTLLRTALEDALEIGDDAIELGEGDYESL